MRKTKFISILLAVCFTIMLLPSFALAATLTDLPNDYSTAALEAAIANGLFQGSDGKILPNDNLTRAQMAALINRAFGATQQSSLSGYTDVSASAWYYADMGKAVQMKVFNGDSGLLKPESAITRQEVFVVLARALKLNDGTAADLAAFADSTDVANWAVGGTAAMITNGYIHGADSKINPKANISRKDFAVLMNNIIKNYITTAGVVTEVKDGSVMINVPGVTLQNVTVKGNLIIGDGVGDGNVTLDNVKVEGSTIVRGGGVNSFIVKGTSTLGTVTIAKVNGNVRVSVEGEAKVEIVEIEDGKDDVVVEGNINKLEVATSDVPVVVQKATIGEVKVTAEKAELTIAKDSKVTTLSAEAAHTSLTIAGTVGTLTATKAAEGAKIDVAKGASVGTVNAAAPNTEIKGEGSVLTANVTGNDIKVDTKGTQLIVATGITGTTTGGKAVEPGTTKTDGQNPSETNPSGGGGVVVPLTVTSIVEKDPGNTGGAGMTFNSTTKTFSGTIDYYAADASLGRAEGNYVGVKISAPTGVIADKNKATFAYTNAKGENKILTGNWMDGDNFVYYYPLVTSVPQTFIVVIDWDGSGVAYAAETITIKISDSTVLTKPIATTSIVEKDPGNTGGADAQFNPTTKTFSGIIDYYAADASLNRAAGNRVGVKITAPNTVKADTAKASFKYTKADGNEATLINGTEIWLDGANFVYYYPLVTKAPDTFTVVIDWDGSGVAYAPETITINIDGSTLLKNSNNSKITKVTSSSELSTALTNAAADETILAAAGTYASDITVDKAVTIQGVGDTTVFTGGMIIASDNVSLKNFKLSYSGTPSQNAGIAINDIDITSMNVIGVTVENYYYGMISSDTNQNVKLSGLTVENCIFQDNLAKGFYAVNLTDSTFKTCQFLNNATTTIDSGNPLVDRSGAGIDLNLMSSVSDTTYKDIVIDGCIFTNNGMLNKADGKPATGGDIKVKARGGSNDPSYSTLPQVIVTGTIVKNCSFGDTSPRHIVIGTSCVADTYVSVNTATGNIGLTKIVDNSKTVSTVERDPGNTGGADAQFNSATKTFSGSIDYYDADAGLNRAAGYRVGVKITAPSAVKVDTAKASFKYTKADGNEATLINGTDTWLDGANFVYYYPLVTKAPDAFTVVIDWDGSGTAYAPETITINIAAGTTLKAVHNEVHVNTESELLAAVALPTSAISTLGIVLDSSITLSQNLLLSSYSALDIPTGIELKIPTGKTLTVDYPNCAVQVNGTLNLEAEPEQVVINEDGTSSGAVHVYKDGKVLIGGLEYVGSTDNSYFKVVSGFLSSYGGDIDGSPAVFGQAITIEGIANSNVILQGVTGAKTHLMKKDEVIAINGGAKLNIAAGMTLNVADGARVSLFNGGSVTGIDNTSIVIVGTAGNFTGLTQDSTNKWIDNQWIMVKNATSKTYIFSYGDADATISLTMEVINPRRAILTLNPEDEINQANFVGHLTTFGINLYSNDKMVEVFSQNEDRNQNVLDGLHPFLYESANGNSSESYEITGGKISQSITTDTICWVVDLPWDFFNQVNSLEVYIALGGAPGADYYKSYNITDAQ